MKPSSSGGNIRRSVWGIGKPEDHYLQGTYQKFESAFQTTFEEALAHYETEEPKGECVIVIAGKPVEEIREEEIRAWEEMPIEEHMEHYLSQGMDKKEAMKAVAKDRGISKRDVYQQLL